MLVFYFVIAALHILSCIRGKVGIILSFVNIAVHIAAFYVGIVSGLELEDMLLLLLFSAAVGLIAALVTRNKKPEAAKVEEQKEASDK